MAVIKVIKKNAEIDGKPIEWNVLAITSYLGGDFQTLELKLTKTEAMLAGMLLSAEESTVTTSKGGEVNIEVRNKSGKKSEKELEELLDL